MLITLELTRDSPELRVSIWLWWTVATGANVVKKTRDRMLLLPLQVNIYPLQQTD